MMSAWLILGALGCAGAGDENGCADRLLPGDLVITELFTDAEGADEGKEWFEIYNASDQSSELDGLALAHSRNDGDGKKSYAVMSGTLAAGAYRVYGGIIQDLKPDFVDEGYGNGLGTLRNTDGRLALACGEVEIDAMTYAASREATSLALNGALAPSTIENDDSANWCASTTPFVHGAGTPGVANDVCGSTSRTRCTEGDTERDLVAPQPGDLVFSEVMANPGAVDDSAGEWFELRVLSAVDVNGLQIGKTADDLGLTVDDRECLRVEAGTHLLFARSSATETNGGLPAVDQTFSFGLTNTSGTLYAGVGGEELDAITWAAADAGVAWSLDPERATPTANDDATSWCGATSAYGAGDRGSPGAGNPPCAIAGLCQDGETRRAPVAPIVGDLVIAEVMPNPAAVDDDLGEWFEVYVANPVDLNGLEIGRTGVDDTLSSGLCLHFDAGSHVLFAVNDDEATNGGLPTVDFTISFALKNSDGALRLALGGELLDAMTWSSSKAGISRALGANALSPDANDLDANWCDGTGSIAGGDQGSPAGANLVCP